MTGKRWNVAGGPYQYSEQQLIVAEPHVGLVLARLDDLAVKHEEPDLSEPLGLACITLVQPGASAEAILGAVERNEAARERMAGFPQIRAELELDTILRGLRALFAADYAGWTPTVGKNRIVGRIHGVGEVSHGGGGDPTPPDHAPQLRQRDRGPGRGARVGVLDTALYPQEWLAGGWTARFSDTLPHGSDPLFAEGHGTFVAGLVLSQAPGATVEVRRVLGADGTADSWTVAKAIVEFGGTGLDVLNLSFLCYTEDGQPPMALAEAIDRLDSDLVVVAAAGNHGGPKEEDGTIRAEDQRRKPAWPAALDDVVAVGACTLEGERAEFSPEAPWVDLHAPGVGLLSTFPDRARPSDGSDPIPFNGYARWSGTSFAAALVSGAVAAATDRSRVSGRAALNDIMHYLKDNARAVPGTHAPFLPLRTLP